MTLGMISVFTLLLAIPPGCASIGESTRLTTDDLLDTTSEMAESLKASDLLRNRSAESSPMYIAPQRIENLSSDRLTAGEQYLLVDGFVHSLPMQSLSRERNVNFLRDHERIEKIASQEGLATSELDRSATHALLAVIRTVRRSGADTRSDGYRFEYSIVSLDTGQEVWRDAFEFKRAAKGTRWD